MTRVTRILLGFALLVAFLAVLVWRLTSVGGPGWHEQDGAAPGPDTAYKTFQHQVMATTVQVVVPAGKAAQEQAETVFDVFDLVDERMSEWKASSPLSAVNEHAGDGPVEVPEDLRRVLHRGIEVGNLTGGAFDVTWAALWGLWNFRAPDPHVPDPAEIARRVKLIDYRKVEIDDQAGTVRLPEKGMKIGLGGIAKGYALSRAAQMLRDRGLQSFMILGGGQVLAAGERREDGGRPWRVGIRDPRGGQQDYFAVLDVVNKSVSTSGDYERYFIADGVRYHHILDPRTGWPARGLRSVTVISPDAVLADGLSTGIMVMGPEKGLALAERLKNVEAVLVDDHGKVETTSGLGGTLKMLHPPRP
jgi:thiamine biosynthesis lipoprotein